MSDTERRTPTIGQRIVGDIVHRQMLVPTADNPSGRQAAAELIDEAIADLRQRAERAEAEAARLREVIQAARDVVCEEINLSNYDHETIIRVSRMWDEADGFLRAALAKTEEREGEG